MRTVDLTRNHLAVVGDALPSFYVNVEQTILRDIRKSINPYVDLDHNGLTSAQTSAVLHALGVLIGGAPDALFAIDHAQTQAGLDLYTFYWLRGATFGALSVQRPADTDASAPRMTGWFRPLSQIRRVDVEADVTADPVIVSELSVQLKVILHWQDGGADSRTVLDATGSMNTYARPALEDLIDRVLRIIQPGV